jgi:Putative zinc-finger
MKEMSDEHHKLHRQAWDLIPWVAAGSASEAENQHVHQHLRTCEDCRQEMAFHLDLVRGLHARSPALPSAEPALQQLWARMDHNMHRAAPAPAPKPAAAPARWLLVAVLVQAVGLVALAGLLLQSRRDAPYQTLSTRSAAAPVAVLHLVPAKTMAMGHLSALLAQHGLQIVESNRDGTVLGLALQAPSAPSAPAAVQALALRLRQEPDVWLVEATATGMGR